MLNKFYWPIKNFIFRSVIKITNFLFGKDLTHRCYMAKIIPKAFQKIYHSLSFAHYKQKRFERLNPDVPWFVPAAIDCLEKNLRPEFVGFEWGSGRSTIWLAKRARHITSIEGQRAWYDKVINLIEENNSQNKIDLKFFDVTGQYNFSTKEIAANANAINDIPSKSLDYIIIDGHFRGECVNNLKNKIKEGGLIVIDNTDVLNEEIINSISCSSIQKYNNGILETTIIRASTNQL